MVARRRTTRSELLDLGVRLDLRYDAERDIVSFANVLLVLCDGAWRAVELFDCSHGDRNDRHRYDRDGCKHPPVIFHHGTAAEGYRTSMRLIYDEYERMIERWAA